MVQTFHTSQNGRASVISDVIGWSWFLIGTITDICYIGALCMCYCHNHMQVTPLSLDDDKLDFMYIHVCVCVWTFCDF